MLTVSSLAGSATLDIGYAIEPKRDHDPVLEAAEKGIECLSDIVNAGSYLVDSVPICECSDIRCCAKRWSDLGIAVKHIPSWFPGAGFKRQAAEWKRSVDMLHLLPFSIAKKNYVSATGCLRADGRVNGRAL